jgi:hypothetical protein
MTMRLLRELISLAAVYEAELPPRQDAPVIPQGRSIATWIDHTLLKPEATAAQIQKLCQEAHTSVRCGMCKPGFVSWQPDSGKHRHTNLLM